MSQRGGHQAGGDEAYMLAGLVAAGWTTKQIAARDGRTVRAVRYALRRHDIDNTADPGHPSFDALLNNVDYLRYAHHVRGLTIVEIARELHRAPSVVVARFRAAGIRTRQPFTYPELQDAVWVQNAFDWGGSLRSIAAVVGCSPSGGA